MTRNSTTSDASLLHAESGDGPYAVIPADVMELLGPPPLVASECPSRFRKFMARFVVDLDPKSMTEWILVDDLVNVSWEIQRYRRARATLITLSCPKVAGELFMGNMTELFKFQEFMPHSAPESATSNRPRSQRPADEAGLRVLAADGLTLEHVYDAALIEKIDRVERFDSMIESLENRREKLYRQFKDHRSLNPEALRQKTNAIVDQF